MEKYFSTDHLRSDLKGRALRGGAITIVTQAVNFIFTLASTAILARLLTPSDFGLVAMIALVLGFLKIFNDFGLSLATIQRSQITQSQVSTLFWLNLALGLSLSLLVAALAPALAWFFDEVRLVSLTLVLATIFLISGLGVQHQALLRRQMQYTHLASIEIAALAIGVALAVAAAMYGAQYWAIAIQMIATPTVSTLGFWIFCRWRPGLPKREAAVVSMLAFGSNLAASNVINFLVRSVDQILIGRVWGESELGSYERASKLQQMPIRLINTPISHVAIPVLCRLIQDPKKYRDAYLKALYPLALTIMPGMAFITIMAHDLIALIMGDQWSRAGDIFAVLGILGLLSPVSNTLGWHYVASGTTSRMLRWGLIDTAFVITAMAIGVSWGGFGVAVAFATVRIVLFLPGIWFATRTVPVTVPDILATIRIPFASSIVMGASVYALSLFLLQTYHVSARLLIAFSFAAVIYLAISCALSRSFSPLFALPRLASDIFKSRG